MYNVMVVDDSKFMRIIIKNVLEKSGKYKVVAEAETCSEAVEKYKEFKPAIVTMDVIMPGESGISSVRKIVEFDKDAKIIMISATGQKKIVEEANELGVIGFIVKPFHQDTFLEEMNKIVESKV